MQKVHFKAGGCGTQESENKAHTYLARDRLLHIPVLPNAAFLIRHALQVLGHGVERPHLHTSHY